MVKAVQLKKKTLRRKELKKKPYSEFRGHKERL